MANLYLLPYPDPALSGELAARLTRSFGPLRLALTPALHASPDGLAAALWLELAATL